MAGYGVTASVQRASTSRTCIKDIGPVLRSAKHPSAADGTKPDLATAADETDSQDASESDDEGEADKV